MLLVVYTVLQPEKFSPLTPWVFIFVELFCFVEQIGFEVLVFGQLVQTLSQVYVYVWVTIVTVIFTCTVGISN